MAARSGWYRSNPATIAAYRSPKTGSQSVAKNLTAERPIPGTFCFRFIQRESIAGAQVVNPTGGGWTPEKLRLDFVFESFHHRGMNLILSTHNVTLTKAIEDHLMTRIEKLEHLNQYAINTRVTLEHDRTKAPGRQFSCSMRISMPGPDLFAEDVEDDLYAAIDIVAKKIEQQFRKRHNKYKARKHNAASRTKRTRQEAEL
jgi:putative sigma-54 modulation protein